MVKNIDSVVEYEASALDKAAGDISGPDDVTSDNFAILLNDLVDKLKAGNKTCAKQLARRASLWAFQLSPIVKDTYIVQHEYGGHSSIGIVVGGGCFTGLESNDPLVGQLQDVIHNARLVLLDQVTDDVLDVFARVSKWLSDNEFDLLREYDKVIRNLEPSKAKAALSYEWVCEERPKMTPETRGGCKKQYDFIKEHSCKAYPLGGNDMPSFATWSRYVREYQRKLEGRVRSKRVRRISNKSVTTRAKV